MVARFQARLDGEPDDVFALLADPSRRAEWDTARREARPLAAGPLAADSRFRMVQRTPLGRRALTIEVTELDPERRVYSEVVVDGAFRGSRALWEVSQTGWGAKVAVVVEIRLSGPLALLAPLVENGVRRHLSRTLLRLEDRFRR